MATDLSAFKLVTPEFRVSYPAVITPKAFKNQAPAWSVTMNFKKTQDISSLKKAAEAVCIDKWGQDRAKWPKNLRSPFRDGDKEKADKEGYQGCWFVKAQHKKSPPGLVGPNKQPILNEADFYAGCYARAEILAYAYDNEFGAGIGFSLQNVQKVRDGEPLSGRSKPEDVFDSVESDSDNATHYPDASSSDGLGF
jgi:Protein of unknown function (DUF2815)